MSPGFRRAAELRVPRGRWGLGALAGFLLLSIWIGPSEAVRPFVRDIIVVDRDSDLTFGDDRGGAIRLRYRFPSTISIAAMPSGLVEPTCAVVLPDRTFLVADMAADPIGFGESNGAIFRADPSAPLATAEVELVAASSLLLDPTDMLLEPDGTVLIVDSAADPNGYGGFPGAVFRLDPETGNLDVVAASPHFVQPRSLSRDRDGSVLICDADADPLDLGSPDGAIFRLNPQTGAVTLFRAFGGTGLTSPSAAVALPTGEYLVVDRDVDLEDPGALRGAVYRFQGDGGPLQRFIADPDFVEPIDLVVGVDRDLWVLDSFSNPNGLPGARGSIFRFDLQTRLRERFITNAIFERLNGISIVTGPETDSTRVTWSSTNPQALRPGNLVTVRARIRNTGTEDADGIVLVDTVRTPWSFVAGSDSVGSGDASFDWEDGVLRWEGDLDRGEETTLRFRMQLDSDVAGGQAVSNRVVVRHLGVENAYTYTETVFDGFRPGSVAFVDERPQDGVGFVALVDPDSNEPDIVYFGEPLVRPVDAVFLDGGTLAIFDLEAVPVEGSGSEAVLLYDGEAGSMQTLWSRETDDGLIAPSGIASDGQGGLILIDRDANPFDHPYTPAPFPPPGDFGPGAAYRIDMDGELSVWFSDSLMTEPVDAEVDRDGVVVVVDFKGTTGNGDLFEYSPASGEIRLRSLTAGGVDWFRDPLGVAIDPLGRAILADAVHFTDQAAGTDRGSILRVVRGGITTYAILSQSLQLVDPSDCYFHDDGYIYIADRDADPLDTDLPDTGAIFRLDPDAGFVETVSAGSALRRPDGVTGWVRVSLSLSDMTLEGAEIGGAGPGDTLRFRFEVANDSRRLAPEVHVEVEGTPNLDIVAVDVSSGESAIDGSGSRASWLGPLGGFESLAMEFTARVRDGHSFGEAIVFDVVARTEDSRVEDSISTTLFSGFLPGQVLVADESADPGETGSPSGAVFSLEPDDDSRVIAAGSPFVDPQAILWDDAGRLLVADRQGIETALLFELDTATGVIDTLVDTDAQLGSPVDLLWSPDGDLLIVSTGAGVEGDATVFRLAGGQPPAEAWAVDERFASPSQAAFDRDGRLFLVDRAANPAGLEGNPAAVFELDSKSGAVLGWFQDPDLPEPTGIESLEDGRMLLTDFVADPNGSGSATGTLFTYDADADSIEVFLASSALRRPYRSVRLPDGDILILDVLALSPDGTTGTVFRFDPEVRTLRSYAWSSTFRILRDVITLPSSQVAFERLEATDRNGPPLHPADRIEVNAMLRNRGPVAAEGVTYRDDLDPAAIIIESSVEASRPGLEPGGDGVAWVGTLAPFDSVEIRYQVQLDPLRAVGNRIQFEPVATGPHAGELTRTVALPVFASFEPGFLYLVDSDADPYGETSGGAGIFKVDLATGAARPYFSDPRLREPVDLLLHGEETQAFYLLDQLARLEGAAGRGILFRLSPATQELVPVAADTTWLSVREMIPLEGSRVLVLDAWADPFGLTVGVGPGAIYEVDLSTGASILRYSSEDLSLPVAFAQLPDGDFAVLDQMGDPLELGANTGQLWRVDLDSGVASSLAVNEAWERPADVAVRPDGEILVLDERATPEGGEGGTGSLWSISAEGEQDTLSLSQYFRSPHRMVLLPNGDPYIADRSADPFGLGHTGALLRWSPFVRERIVPMATSSLFRTPQGFVIYRDLTPVVVLPWSVSPEDEGVRVQWEGLPGRDQTRYLIYRRLATGPDDPGDESAEGYDLLASASEFRGEGPHEHLDQRVEPGVWYVYLIAIVEPDGRVDVSPAQIVQAPADLLRLGLRGMGRMPFADETHLRLVVPRGEDRVRLTVHDVSGRRVKTLVSGRLPAGVHERRWDGRDDRGHPLPSGVYFARLEHGTESRVVRLVRVR